MELFKGEQDRFNGITVNTLEEPCLQSNLQTKLQDSLKAWKESGKRCIWFKVDVKDSAWVPVLANEGFDFHHAREGFVMMFKWLPKGSEHNLPPASHNNLGVGGLVLNDKNQLLAVSEKHYEYPHWKLPGGYVDRGEYIPNAAIREVKEETGIETEYESIIALRHTHKMMFDNSDIYVLVLLKPVSNKIKICTREINEAKWMNVEEFLNHPNVHKLNRLVVSKALEYKRKGIKISSRIENVKFGNWNREMMLFTVDNL